MRKRYKATKWEADGAPVSLSSESTPREGGRAVGEAGRGRARSLCPAPRSLDKTPVGNDSTHCRVLNVLTEKMLKTR